MREPQRPYTFFQKECGRKRLFTPLLFFRTDRFDQVLLREAFTSQPALFHL